jgi:prephenate dehydrogenase
MWRDICLANRDLLLADLGGYRAQLARIEDCLQRGDGAALQQLFETARHARNEWLRTIQW